MHQNLVTVVVVDGGTASRRVISAEGSALCKIIGSHSLVVRRRAVASRDVLLISKLDNHDEIPSAVMLDENGGIHETINGRIVIAGQGDSVSRMRTLQEDEISALENAPIENFDYDGTVTKMLRYNKRTAQ